MDIKTLVDGLSVGYTSLDGYQPQIRNIRERHNREFWIGHEHPEYADILYKIVKLIQPKNVLELGFQCGGSAYGILKGMNNEGVYIGIDNEYSPAAIGGMSDFNQAYEFTNATYIIGKSSSVLSLLSCKWDLIHFDHAKDLYLPDLSLLALSNQIDENTICIFHDTDNHAKEYKSEIISMFNTYHSINAPEGALVAWEYKS